MKYYLSFVKCILLVPPGRYPSVPTPLHRFEEQKYVCRPSKSPTLPADPQPHVQHRRTTVSTH
jgi:hypothetical protein